MADDAQEEIKIDANEDRKYDIVIYGATGFTGAIAASEFIKRYASSAIDFKWAISGRNKQKLEKLRGKLRKEFKSEVDALSKETANAASSANKQEYIANLPIIIADVTNEESLKAMLTSTRLVISCIGPYRLVGEKVLQLCALNGTHYVDICGEPDFMERCAFKYYSAAESTGALIVSACGFDSVPSDIGCSFIEQFYLSNGGICSSINGYLTATAPDGYPCHHTTLKAAVLGMSEADKLRALRKEIKQKDYRIG